MKKRIIKEYRINFEGYTSPLLRDFITNQLNDKEDGWLSEWHVDLDRLFFTTEAIYSSCEDIEGYDSIEEYLEEWGYEYDPIDLTECFYEDNRWYSFKEFLTLILDPTQLIDTEGSEYNYINTCFNLDNMPLEIKRQINLEKLFKEEEHI